MKHNIFFRFEINGFVLKNKCLLLKTHVWWWISKNYSGTYGFTTRGQRASASSRKVILLVIGLDGEPSDGKYRLCSIPRSEKSDSSTVNPHDCKQNQTRVWQIAPTLIWCTAAMHYAAVIMGSQDKDFYF